MLASREVHHGRLFATAPPPSFMPTPNVTMPSTPATHSGSSSPDCCDPSAHSTSPHQTIYPNICFGFKIQNLVIYLSDVSHIPDDAWTLFEQPVANGDEPHKPHAVLVLDCLRLDKHTSHYGLKDAVDVARRMGARRTYLTGFGHEVSHDEYVTIGEVVEGKKVTDQTRLTPSERRGMKIVEGGTPFWLRPAHDGLKVDVSEGAVHDTTYDAGEHKLA
jgi:hypothetical protein